MALDSLGERLAAPRIPRRGKGRRRWYRTVYLQSEHWRWLRKQVAARSNGICERCCTRRGSQVHHLSYRRLWREHPRDLELVCTACHEARHRRGALAGTDFTPLGRWLATLLFSPLFAVGGGLVALVIFSREFGRQRYAKLMAARVARAVAWPLATVLALLGGLFAAGAVVVGVPLLILAEPLVVLGLRVRFPGVIERRLIARWESRHEQVIAARWGSPATAVTQA